MPIHMFTHKYPQSPSTPPVAVLWYPAENVKYHTMMEYTAGGPAGGNKWKVFTQEDIIVQAHNFISIELRLSEEMSFGVIVVSLMQQSKKN
jgi:hypothetical protein